MTGIAIGQSLSEKGLLPDRMVRYGVRKLLHQRLKDSQVGNITLVANREQKHLSSMDKSDIAEVPERANEQHYEQAAAFFEAVLGQHLKYSCSLWNPDIEHLDAAEAAALDTTCQRAGLENGMKVLELGCGWGALTLWMAEHYPHIHITAVSNSQSQRVFIYEQTRLRGLENVEVITADMNEFDTQETFDRVISVEMFEHMRNWSSLLRRISHWLSPTGQFFMHIFVHRNTPYFFEDLDATDWMSRHFFSGGMMPSWDLPLQFQQDLKLETRWAWDGRHYEKTCNAWLQKMDVQKDALWPQFEATYGRDFSSLWWMRWRMFFIACSELFGYNDGQEWFVGHYKFSNRRNRM